MFRRSLIKDPKLYEVVESWWAHRDLNPEPRNYEFRALTVEL